MTPNDDAESLPQTLLFTAEEAEIGSSPRRKAILQRDEMVGGAFRILRVLGEGGMGQVYEAEDVNLHRRVALKIAWPGMPSVRHEASVLAALRHPAMVTVFHFGEHRDLEYVVMERIYGISLQARLDHLAAEGLSFDVREAIDVLTGVCEGLSALHFAGVSHRDLKPGNIMLTPQGRVVLMDLGIAVPEVEAEISGRAAGSAGYIAPETLKDEVRRGGGHLIDVYALGSVAYHMLAGRTPFQGSVERILFAHVMTDPSPLLELRPDLPVALAELVHAMLSKNPEDRPSTAEDIADALRSIRTEPSVGPSMMPRATMRPATSLSVLLVDDDATTLQLMTMAARSVGEGIHVETARSGEDALQAVGRSMPDLVLLDLKMPEMNGLEVILHLRGARRTRRTNIVPVSASATGPDRTLLRELGIGRFVLKGPELMEGVRSEVAHAFSRKKDRAGR